MVYPSGETETLLDELYQVAEEQRQILQRQSELIDQLRMELRGVRVDDEPTTGPE